MAIADLNPRDYMRLFNAFKEARKRSVEIVPSAEQLIPEIKNAVNKDGDLVDNLALVFGDSIRQGFDVVREVVVEAHGEEYTADLWSRFMRREA